MKERRAETTTMRAMLVGTFYYLHVNGVRAEKVMPLVIKHQVSSYLPSLSSWSHKFLNSPSTLFLYMALSTDQCLERWAWNMYRNDSTAYTLVIGEHCDSATFLISLSWLSILTEWKPTCQTFLFHHLIFLSFHSIIPILKGKGKSFPIPPRPPQQFRIKLETLWGGNANWGTTRTFSFYQKIIWAAIHTEWISKTNKNRDRTTFTWLMSMKQRVLFVFGLDSTYNVSLVENDLLKRAH